MNYSVMVADGDWKSERKVTEVTDVKVEDGVYLLSDKNGAVLFSSPVESLVYLEVD